jgi:hypothetical protein
MTTAPNEGKCEMTAGEPRSGVIGGDVHLVRERLRKF